MSKAGRKSRRGSPMPRSAITAYEEHLVFLLLYGRDNYVSSGVRRTIDRVLELERGEANGDSATETMRKARWMVRMAREELGEDASQQEVWDYLRVMADHFQWMERQARAELGEDATDEQIWAYVRERAADELPG